MPVGHGTLLLGLHRGFQALRAAGIDLLRISPQSIGTVAVLQAWRRALDGELPADDSPRVLAGLSPAGLANGFWRGRPGSQAA